MNADSRLFTELLFSSEKPRPLGRGGGQRVGISRDASNDKAWAVIMGGKKTYQNLTTEMIETARMEPKKFGGIERKLKKLGMI